MHLIDQALYSKFRVARPTDNLAGLEDFYRHGLGLTEIGRFENHAGYSGVMLGVPGEPWHLEFTRHGSGSPCPPPTKDNLLVFYLNDDRRLEEIVQRLNGTGYFEVEPENPYWQSGGVTFEDPDGWRVVLAVTQ